ncbi:rRNA cytosine-C5-methyltransferase [uncultured Bacteroides sp.]|uniref:methyltransferase RsmF C-terminal domain-like protein n=1 Tax=uncultured Bacteroides sp. TaxID=162156 RepID=UPI002AABF60C|nr:rRNA cytosine-C5-methyltransferase [uncultured Bacteroides sp.]
MKLPIPFINQNQALLGEEEYARLECALQEESPVSIRMNETKSFSHEETIKVPWCSTGFYLNKRLTFTFDPLFHAGCYYVQEASSMFVEQVVSKYITEPTVALDLCAAPGGKSTHVRSLLPDGSFLVANEVIRNRSQILAENLIKWGQPDVAVTNNDPADFSSLGSLFDLILTDVPCSGEGMFRKDPGAIEEWSPENVTICYQRQRRIIADIWPSLKLGGILIYSTCTYNLKEDEENIEWIKNELGAESLSVDVPQEWGITGNLAGTDTPVYRFLPHKTKGEGFFLAALRKMGEEDIENLRIKSSKKNKKEKPLEIPLQAKQWLQHPEDFDLERRGDFIIACKKTHKELVNTLYQQLKVVHSGIIIGEVKGKDLLPHQSLAMSNELNTSQFSTYELSYEQAISYLRKEAITLDISAPRGYVLLEYKNIPLGFVKNIGNRANNLYPQEWRIRSGYLPEEVRCL